MDSGLFDGPLPPNTPQDVVLPHYQSRPNHPLPPIISGPISDEPEVIDFTYVNISEDDAEGIGVLVEGEDLDFQPETQRGDILTILLSGMQQYGTDEFLVSSPGKRLCVVFVFIALIRAHSHLLLLDSN